MASLFGSLPSVNQVQEIRSSLNKSSVLVASTTESNNSPSTVLSTNENEITPPPSSNGLQWIHDDEALNCMQCNEVFTFLTRKHHCRRCGHVVCANCSPHKRRISISNPFPMRVCNSCYAAVDEHFASMEWSGITLYELPSTPDPVIEGRVHIGQLYVKVVEAIGLPNTDAISSDPFVRLQLTGRWSHGQEWSPDFRTIKCTKKKSRTLNPRWHETFVFNVYAPRGELYFEVYNYGSLSQPTKLGMASVELNQLMDQRRHNKWLDLSLPEKLRRPGLNNDTRAGRIHVLLQYKFSRSAEFFSYFAKEPAYQHDWPEFDAGRLYSNFWVFLDYLWPYLEVFWGILPTLSWEHPTFTFICFCFSVWLCLSVQWIPVVMHLGLIVFVLRNYFEVNMQTYNAQENEMAGRNTAYLHSATLRSSETMDRYQSVPETSLSNGQVGINGNMTIINTKKGPSPGVRTVDVSVTNSAPHLGRFDNDMYGPDHIAARNSGYEYRYTLPMGFNRLMNRMTHISIDEETKQTLQSVQNSLAWWSNILGQLEFMFSWEDGYYTAKVLLALLVSCVLHIICPNKYLLLAAVVYLFVQWTVPFQGVRHVLSALRSAIRSILLQHRLRRSEERSGRQLRPGISGFERGPLGPAEGRYDRLRRKLSSSGSSRAHYSVSKKEEMFEAAASAISARFTDSRQSQHNHNTTKQD